MSRTPSNPSQGSSSSSSNGRFKISAPQPYQPPARPPHPSNASSSFNVSSTSGSGAGGGASAPMRPARSIRRAPNPPDGPSHQSSSSSYAGSSIPPAFQRRESDDRLYSPIDAQPGYGRFHVPPPPQTQTNGHGQQQAAGSSYDVEPSSSVTTASTTSPQWDQDRTQRSEIIRMQQEQAQRSEKLRGVVDAFRKAPTNSSSSTTNSSRPPRSDARTIPATTDTYDPREMTSATAPSDADLLLGRGGAEFEDVDSVLRRIRRDWPFVLDANNFAPTTLALSLLEPVENPRGAARSTALASHPPLQDFTQLHSQLSTALSRAVQKHYQAYASSLPAHRNLMDAMTRAQGMVKQTRKHLKESRGMLQQKGPATSKRSEMIQLRAREKNLRDMLRALDAIEQLKAVPDQLESLVGDKRFLQASLLLIRSLRAINNQDLLVVGALTELRSYLRGQLDTLADILIEELQNHLYLKSFYTRTRWTAYQAGQTECESRQARTGHTTDTSALATVPKTPYDLEDDSLSFLADPTIHEEAQRKGDSRLSRFLTSLALKPSVDPTLHVTDEELVQASTSIHRRAGTATSVNLPADAPTAASPEADSFAYVEMLLESLTTLGRLGYAIDVTTQRLPSELFGVVETVIEEVGERAEIRKVQGIAAKRPKSMQLTEDDDARPASVVLQKTNHDRGNHFRAQIAGLQGSEENSETLKDLFWTTCSKIGAVVEGHRAVYEIVTRITMRGNYRDSSGPNAERSVLVVPLDDIVKPIQAEMRTLVHDYLTDRDRGSSVNRKPLMPINEILREGKVARDKSQVLFRFSDTVPGQELEPYKAALNGILQASLPGLAAVPESAGQQSAAISSGTDRLQEGLPHTLLVTPNPFNVVTVFQPCLAFIRRVRVLAPNLVEIDGANFGTYMDEFVVKVYLPQLEDKVISLYQQAVGGSQAFIQDPFWRECSRFPIVKSATDVMALVITLCKMMASAPFRNDDYSRLVINLIVRYYQRCSSRYRDIVAKSIDNSDLPLSATWAQREDVLDHVRAIREASSVNARERSLRLLQLEGNLLDDRHLDVKKDLISSGAGFRALAELYQSICWLMDELDALKAVADDAFSPTAELPSLNLPTRPRANSNSLLLSAAMSQRFDAILLTYGQLAEMILFTMHTEVRCMTMTFIQSSYSKGTYRLDTDIPSPDSFILDLTLQLRECEGIAKTTLSPQDASFIFKGLGWLADASLIRFAKYVRHVTPFGIHKVFRNIATLQQALRSILDAETDDVELERSQAYWTLFEHGPKDMLDGIQAGKRQFTFDEYNHMLDLQCGMAGASKSQQSSSAMSHSATDASTTRYNEFLIDLHSMALDSEF